MTERPFQEPRPFSVKWNPMCFALSSLIISTGNTSVICSVSLQEGVPKWREGTGKGWISAEYRLLPGSTPQRKERELINLSGRTQEIQRLIGRSLRTVVDMSLLGERTLLIDCDVLQADAGTRTASITGAWIALQKGCSLLIEQGLLAKNPIKGQVAAISVALIKGQAFLDPSYAKDSIADVDLNVVMDSAGGLLELQGTAERAPFSRLELDNVLDVAWPAIQALQSSQLSALAN